MRWGMGRQSGPQRNHFLKSLQYCLSHFQLYAVQSDFTKSGKMWRRKTTQHLATKKRPWCISLVFISKLFHALRHERPSGVMGILYLHWSGGFHDWRHLPNTYKGQAYTVQTDLLTFIHRNWTPWTADTAPEVLTVRCFSKFFIKTMLRTLLWALGDLSLG
jgi:hypothetical protein